MSKLTLFLIPFILAFVQAGSSGHSNKISPALLEQLVQSSKTPIDIIISFQAGTKSVLNQFNLLEFGTREARINHLVKLLKEHANESQAGVISFLSSPSSAFEYVRIVQFWISNQLFVKGLSNPGELIEQLAQFEEVEQITNDEQIPVLQYEVVGILNETEWNIEDIQAPPVWSLGSNGTGVRIASISTGVLWSHESYASNYLGLYGWFDPYQSSFTPNDGHGIGTHLNGLLVGKGGIGVAPGASWQSCKGCDNSGACTTSALVACGQWVTCPTLANGDSPNCSLAPHVVSNGFGGGQGNTFYDAVISAWHAAHIIPIFGVGGSPNVCGAVSSPADSRSGVIAVGAYTTTHTIGSSSGPTVYGELKPDLVAPGSNIRSASSSSDTGYTIISGSTNGPPHVAGVVGLLFGFDQSLSYDHMRALLLNNTDSVTSSGRVCDGIPDTVYPNYAAGYGKVNALKAAEDLLGGGRI